MSSKYALISVSDKSGVVEFASALAAMGFGILSTGGTAKLLAANGVSVKEVAEHTGFRECMDGRVKTLHPKIHGGILGRAGTDDAIMQELGIDPIDVVVVNLYPFRQTIDKPGCSMQDAIENIDIGGPAMLRAAAKNHARVTVIVDPADYAPVIAEMQANAGKTSDALRYSLATRVFEHTAAYDGLVACWLGQRLEDANNPGWPRTLNLQFTRAQEMRYGENPHQKAAFYIEDTLTEPCVATAKQLQGKALSYNNIGDTDAALECVKQFAEGPACVIVKHANPCGVALGDSPLAAYERAYATDPESAFGGIIAFNRELDEATAKAIIERQFVEVIIAPSISDAAAGVCAEKKNVRLLACGQWPETRDGYTDYKRVRGGMLVQDSDALLTKEIQVVTERAPTEAEMRDLLFAWRIAKYVKSNAIVYAKDGMSIGVGAGQMSRINSARIAGIKAELAGLEVKGSVMASDAFFPFRDGIDAAAKAGIVAVIEPGGSMRDDEVIAAADEYGMAMVFTSMRHFRH